MADTPTPDYLVIASLEDVEIREYDALLIAEVETAGERAGAIRDGFRILADFIFGGNDGAAGEDGARDGSGAKIAMTAPVLQTPSPRAEQSPGAAPELWRVSFIMPEGRSLETLPRPNDARVKLRLQPAARMVAIRFSGVPWDSALTEKTQELRAALARAGTRVEGPPIYAFYNSPFTLPFLRRNEVMFRLSEQGASRRTPGETAPEAAQ